MEIAKVKHCYTYCKKKMQLTWQVGLCF